MQHSCFSSLLLLDAVSCLPGCIQLCGYRLQVILHDGREGGHDRGKDDASRHSFGEHDTCPTVFHAVIDSAGPVLATLLREQLTVEARHPPALTVPFILL